MPRRSLPGRAPRARGIFRALALAALGLALALYGDFAGHAAEDGPRLLSSRRQQAAGNVDARTTATSLADDGVEPPLVDEAVAQFLAFEARDAAGDAVSIDDDAVSISDEPAEAVMPGVPAAGCGHELWIVSTRGLPDAPCGVELAPFTPCVERFICGSGWIPATLEELVAGGEQSSTAVFVHGNDTNADDARELAQQLYCQIFATNCPAPPTRLVVWSWPSERVLLRRRSDVQVKACRTNIEGYYLATFIDLLPGESHANLAGFSYGARVVTGSLHLLGGGTLAGRQLGDRQHPQRSAESAILAGAAMDNDWLQPGRRHERALSQVERLVILYNPKDCVLHFYPHLWGRGGAEALGVTGVAQPAQLGPEAAKIEQVNVRPELHCRHAWKFYSRSPTAISSLRRELVY